MCVLSTLVDVRASVAVASVSRWALACVIPCRVRTIGRAEALVRAVDTLIDLGACRRGSEIAT